MFKAILGLFSSLPKIIGWIEQLAAYIKEQWISYQNAKKKKEMERAVDEAGKTGDTSGIDDLFKNPGGKK